MEPNNLCRHLVVLANHAPGGTQHELLADVPGTWTRGRIRASRMPDGGMGPGEGQEIVAWLLSFADTDAGLFTDAWEAQSRRLHDLWTELDARMGLEVGRDQCRWWPEGVETVVNGDMIVVNTYRPLSTFPWLANPQDVPHPNEADDVRAMWRKVVTGGATYEWSHFLGLLKDVHPSEYDALFTSLLPTGVEGFVARMQRLWAEHDRGADSLLRAEGDETWSLYLLPQARHRLPEPALLEQARGAIEQAATVLRDRIPGDPGAAALRAVDVRVGTPASDQAYGPAAQAWDTLMDLLSESTPEDHWAYCLGEAAYGVSASYPLRYWLMQPFTDLPVDLEPFYVIWRSGGRLDVSGGVAWVVVDR